LPSVEEGNILDLDAAFVELLTAAMLTTGKDESRPAFIKTCLDILTEESYLVSTDAHFLFRHKLDIKCATPEQILFSHKVAKAIEGMDAISLCWSDKTICIKTENVTIWNSRFEDKYPNYKLIIPAYEPTLALVKADLEAALNKACISSNQTKQTTIILNKEDGMVHFETDDSEYSRKIHVKIPGKDSGNAATVSINAKKMLIMMDQFKSKNINLHIFSAEKAVLISTDEDADYLGLLMPLIANS
jgi:DNA polymerase III sliding clamp (beta) subunit (PCNA family)